jgi:asparagine synthase (glutamine-hydrolysing)
MCGICGIVDIKGRRPIDRTRLSRMQNRLVHRGPDGEGEFVAAGVALGHRRLSIIDIDGGRQPIFNETGSVAVIFNGEIYNFRELAVDLTKRGHRLVTRSDSEVIAHAWEEWGEFCVERFNGMFAFAIWDADREVLFLARDRCGEKPLYYTMTADGLVVFASELGALLAALREGPPLDTEAIEDYFAYGYVPEPKTIHSGIMKLPPGHTMRLARGKPLAEPRCYWDVRFEVQSGTNPDELASRLRRAVEMRMYADVPLGAFLSGGIDSSSVVSLMDEVSSHAVRTCSIGFGDRNADESHYAQLVADRYRTDHHCKVVEPDACALVDRLALAYGEPFADSSALPTYLLSGLTRQHVTVALSGDGGDEVFAGYPRYAEYLRQEQLRAFLPNWLRQTLFEPLATYYPKLDWAPRILRGKATFESLAADEIEGYFRAVTIFPTAVRRATYSGDFLAALRDYNSVEVLRRHAARAGTSDPVALAQYLDLKVGLPGDMLVKVDRASMAHSLEVRAPFLDHTLIEWAAGLGRRQKVVGHDGKRALKHAMRSRLPDAIVDRRKQGFSPPIGAWLRRELADRLREVVHGPTLSESGLFSMPRLRKMVERHISGISNHSGPLWAFLLFDAFLRLPRESAGELHAERSAFAVG